MNYKKVLENWDYKACTLSGYIALAYLLLGLTTERIISYFPFDTLSICPLVGLSLFSVLKWNKAGLVGILIGAFLLNISIYGNVDMEAAASNVVLLSVIISIGVGVHGAFGAFLINRYIGYPKFLIEDRAIIKFLFLGCLLPCIVLATWLNITLYIFDQVHPNVLLNQWLVVWTAGSIGTVLILPILISCFEKDQILLPKAYRSVIWPMIIVLFASCFFQFHYNQHEFRKHKLEFNQHAIDLKRYIETTFDSYIEVIYAMKGFFDSSNYVDRDEFNTFVTPVFERHHEIHGLNWIEYVEQNEKDKFIAAIREEGFPEFNIFNKKNPVIENHEKKDGAYVIKYIEPFEINRAAFGLDIMSSKIANDAANNARDSGLPVITQVLTLAQDDVEKNGLVIYLPVYKNNQEILKIRERQENLYGFIAAVLKINTIVSELFLNVHKEKMHISIRDKTAELNSLVYENVSNYWYESLATQLMWEGNIPITNREWQIEFYPTDDYIIEHVVNSSNIFLFFNMLSTLLIAGWLLSFSGRHYRIEQIVSERTNDLKKEIKTRTRIQEQLSYQASHDALTGLVNRREFETKLVEAMQEVICRSESHVVCMMDLDHFKIVNDTSGHVAGDELLKQVSKLISKRIRKTDLLARLGGDEFVLLLRYCDINTAKLICSDIIKIVEKMKFAWGKKSFTIGVSIGIVKINAEENKNEIMKSIDDSCYMAKKSGRNRIYVYDDEAHITNRGEIEWINKINDAMNYNKFCLFAQKIQSVKQGADIYELLIRMRDDDGNMISPGVFLPAAERYNLIEKLDKWVVQHVFHYLADVSFKDSLPILCINLSARSISRLEFSDEIIEKAKNYGIITNKICFEITETAAISNLSDAEEFIYKLKEAGFLFALDDFGSGFSSFAYLKNLPVDHLKVDGSFVKDILENEIDKAMVKSINEIGHVMGKETIAEFVETQEIADVLKEIGVDYIQGYGVSLPEPMENILEMYFELPKHYGNFSI